METQTTERSYKDDHLQDRLRHYEAQAQLVETLQRELHNSQVRATVSQKNHSLSLHLHPPPLKREREGKEKCFLNEDFSKNLKSNLTSFHLISNGYQDRFYMILKPFVSV